jgi:hypothetical protein
MILVVVVLALAVGFLGGSLYEKRSAQSIVLDVDDRFTLPYKHDELQVWLRQCATSGKCVIEGKIE